MHRARATWWLCTLFFAQLTLKPAQMWIYVVVLLVAAVAAEPQWTWVGGVDYSTPRLPAVYGPQGQAGPAYDIGRRQWATYVEDQTNHLLYVFGGLGLDAYGVSGAIFSYSCVQFSLLHLRVTVDPTSRTYVGLVDVEPHIDGMDLGCRQEPVEPQWSLY